jgi:hypothetical protein
MTLIVTSEFELNRVVAPRLPTAPPDYEKRYHDQFADVLRLYFNRLDNILGQLVATMETIPVSIGGTNVDAFGRLRVSNPFTLFDSQNRYQKDNQFAESTATGGTVTYTLNESTVNLNVTSSSGSKTVRQSYRVMPYQPGKGLLFLGTFVMAVGQANLRQRVGYFNPDNGVFFQKDGTTNAFVLRTNTSGTPSDTRTITQANWNGDKLDGTGASGLTLDTTKSQILWMDFEWLGVGSVRCGFIINGQYIVCHTFNNANDLDKVYMTTAILPVRYEIEATGALTGSATLKQICSTVVTEGGYQQVVASQYARTTTAVTGFDTTFVPLVSIRLASDSLGAVVLPQVIQVLPTVSQDYEVALFKNATLTGASYDTTTFSHVDFDVSATAMTGGTMVLQSFLSSTTQGRQVAVTPTGYNFDLQLGVDLSGVSDVFTLGVRTLDANPTGDAFGVIDFIDLTD